MEAKFHDELKKTFVLPYVPLPNNQFRVCDILLVTLDTLEAKKEYMLNVLDIYIMAIRWFLKPTSRRKRPLPPIKWVAILLFNVLKRLTDQDSRLAFMGKYQIPSVADYITSNYNKGFSNLYEFGGGGGGGGGDFENDEKLTTLQRKQLVAMRREQNEAQSRQRHNTDMESYAKYEVLNNWILATLDVCLLAKETIQKTTTSASLQKKILSRTCSFLLRVYKVMVAVAQKGDFPPFHLTSPHQRLTAFLTGQPPPHVIPPMMDRTDRTTAIARSEIAQSKGIKRGQYWKRELSKDRTAAEIQSLLKEKLHKMLSSVLSPTISEDKINNMVKKVHQKNKLDMETRRLLLGLIKYPSQQRFHQVMKKI